MAAATRPTPKPNCQHNPETRVDECSQVGSTPQNPQQPESTSPQVKRSAQRPLRPRRNAENLFSADKALDLLVTLEGSRRKPTRSHLDRHPAERKSKPPRSDSDDDVCRESETSAGDDDFLMLELSAQKVEEDPLDGPNDRTVPNFAKMVRILRQHAEDQRETRCAIAELSNHKFEHFVLLLSRPLLQLTGVYVLKATMKHIAKIWGDGPALIAASQGYSFFRYDVMSEEFELVQRRGFEHSTDAISL
jgi:hypothetical protein